MVIVNFEDWEKIDLRVGQIQNTEDVEGADKLYKLIINIGDETKTVVAGLKPYYSHDDLKGRKVVLFTNLAPRKLKGIESQGMILAAVSDDKKKVVLISPSEDIEVGAKIQ